MSLDKNLYTLNIVPSKESPPDTDLIDPSSSNVQYRKRRQIVPGSGYTWSLYDPLSDALLATISGANSTSKKKTIELHDPPVTVEFSFSGTMSFKWSFVWEEHEFEWKKDSCYMLRKPDPPVMIAVTEPERKNKCASVQLLDYNLNRFDIEDRKGLELVLLSVLLCFQDYTDGFKDPAHTATTSSLAATPAATNLGAQIPPSVPAKTPGEQILAAQSRARNDPNVIVVEDGGSVADYANHCCGILKEEGLVFIVIRASSAAQVSKVVQVVEETKRRRRRDPDVDDEELHQYVSYNEDTETQTTNKGKKTPKIIKLDDGGSTSKNGKKEEYKPPTTLTIHLSKIPMPELMPKAPPSRRVSDPRPGTAPRPRTPPPRIMASAPAPAPNSRLTKPNPNNSGGRAPSPSPPMSLPGRGSASPPQPDGFANHHSLPSQSMRGRGRGRPMSSPAPEYGRIVGPPSGGAGYGRGGPVGPPPGAYGFPIAGNPSFPPAMYGPGPGRGGGPPPPPSRPQPGALNTNVNALSPNAQGPTTAAPTTTTSSGSFTKLFGRMKSSRA